MSESELPNPLRTAKRISGVHVSLRPDELIYAWPNLCREVAERLLDRHGGTIAGAMLGAGLRAANEIIREEGGMS